MVSTKKPRVSPTLGERKTGPLPLQPVSNSSSVCSGIFTKELTDFDKLQCITKGRRQINCTEKSYRKWLSMLRAWGQKEKLGLYGNTEAYRIRLRDRHLQCAKNSCPWPPPPWKLLEQNLWYIHVRTTKLFLGKIFSNYGNEPGLQKKQMARTEL